MNRRDLGLEGAYESKSMAGGQIGQFNLGKSLVQVVNLTNSPLNKRRANNQWEFSHLIAVRRKWDHL